MTGEGDCHRTHGTGEQVWSRVDEIASCQLRYRIFWVLRQRSRPHGSQFRAESICPACWPPRRCSTQSFHTAPWDRAPPEVTQGPVKGHDVTGLAGVDVEITMGAAAAKLALAIPM